MSLADDLEQIPPSQRGRTSAPNVVERIIASYEGSDRAAIEQAFRSPWRYPATKLSRWLADHGHSVSHTTISAWRRANGIT